MTQRKLKFKPNDSIEKCPKCGNNTEFTFRSEQVCEDGCEVWVICKCGFDPTAEDTGNRMEDVMGGVDDGNCRAALHCSWNDVVINLSTQGN